MKSQWFRLKNQAIKLRKKGQSLREIEKKLGIARSTLSGWLKTTQLTDKQNLKLKESWNQGLVKARKKAVIWHNEQKQNRLKEAGAQALKTFSKLDLEDTFVLELALAMLYLGEGAKDYQTCLGNSNPLVLNFFIAALKKVYNFDISKIRCELHLRADQNPSEMQDYWSKELGIPLTNFISVSLDQRSLGRTTYPNYKGVCILRCGNVALQRRLVYLSQIFCKNITI